MEKKVTNLVKYEFLKWLLNTKNLIVLVLIMFIRNIVVLPLVEAATSTNQPINMWESCIALGNSGVILFLLPLFFVVLISDFPSIDTNIYYYIVRVGKRKWFLSQCLVIILTALMYIGILFLTTFLQTIRIAYVENGWSLVITKYGEKYNLNHLIPLNLHNQVSPSNAMMLTFILLLLYLIFIGSVMLFGFVYGKKLYSMIVAFIMIAIGMGLASLSNKYMWLFPSAHSILYLHYDKYLRNFIFSPLVSIVLLLILGGMFTVIAFLKWKRVDLEKIREN